jgi:hypothetical protein
VLEDVNQPARLLGFIFGPQVYGHYAVDQRKSMLLEKKHPQPVLQLELFGLCTLLSVREKGMEQAKKKNESSDYLGDVESSENRLLTQRVFGRIRRDQRVNFQS